MRVLLIDDDKDDQAFFLEAMDQMTDEVLCETADSGNEGLKRLNVLEHLPDVLFLDINMPMMDGKETLDAIRKDSKLAMLDIVILSTSNSEVDIRWASDHNARYLVKPNDFTTLLSSLATMLNIKLISREKLLIRQAC